MQSVGAADFTSGNPVELATATFLRVHYQGSSNTPTPTPTRKRRVIDSVIKNGDSCELLLCACKLHAVFCCISYCTRSSSPSSSSSSSYKKIELARMSQIFAKSQTLVQQGQVYGVFETKVDRHRDIKTQLAIHHLHHCPYRNSNRAPCLLLRGTRGLWEQIRKDVCQTAAAHGRLEENFTTSKDFLTNTLVAGDCSSLPGRTLATPPTLLNRTTPTSQECSACLKSTTLHQVKLKNAMTTTVLTPKRQAIKPTAAAAAAAAQEPPDPRSPLATGFLGSSSPGWASTWTARRTGQASVTTLPSPLFSNHFGFN